MALARPRQTLGDFMARMRPEHHEVLAMAQEVFRGEPVSLNDFVAVAHSYHHRLRFPRGHMRKLHQVYQLRNHKGRGALRSKPNDMAAIGLEPMAVGHPCRYCGRPADHMDHVWPRARGGDDHPNNLVPACQSCNSRKSARSVLGSRCPGCGHERHPADVDTSTGDAFYSCRCGSSWSHRWNLQAASFAA